MRKTYLLLVAIAVFAGCKNKQGAGAGLGILFGAAAGSSVSSDSGGKLLGAFIGGALGGIAGSYIGKALDEHDKRLMAEARSNALELGRSGSPVAWKNPDNGHRGTVVPGPAFQREGRYYRKYTEVIEVGDQTFEAKGHAYRDEGGVWQINQDEERVLPRKQVTRKVYDERGYNRPRISSSPRYYKKKYSIEEKGGYDDYDDDYDYTRDDEDQAYGYGGY